MSPCAAHVVYCFAVARPFVVQKRVQATIFVNYGGRLLWGHPFFSSSCLEPSSSGHFGSSGMWLWPFSGVATLLLAGLTLARFSNNGCAGVPNNTALGSLLGHVAVCENISFSQLFSTFFFRELF